MRSGKVLLVVLLTATVILSGCGDDRPGAAAKLVNITVTATSASLALGTTTQLTATGTFNDGSSQTLTNVTWSTSNAAVATVSANGVITTKAQGTATITAMSGTVTATITINVGPAVLASLSISPTTASMPLGLTKALFSVTGTMTDGTPASGFTVTLSSSDEAVAIIGSQRFGWITARGLGTTTITATSGPVSVSATLTVTPPVLATVTVTPANPSIIVGTAQQFMAIAVWTDNTAKDVTATAVWHSGDTAVATLDATTAGLFHGAGAGTAQVTATEESITGGTSLTVANAVAFVYATAFVQASQSWVLKSFAAAQDGQMQEIGSRLIDSVSGRMVTDGAKFIYIDSGNGGVIGFAVDQTTGALTPLPTYTAPQGTSVESFAIDQTAHRLYGFDAISAVPAIKVLNIDQQTGALTDSGLSYGFTGSTAPNSGHNNAVFVSGQNGKYFFWGGGSGSCATYGGSGPCTSLHGYVVDNVTGALAEMAGSPFDSVSPQIWSMAISTDQTVLWVSLDAYRIVSYSVDQLTGLPTQIDYWFPLGQGAPIPAMAPQAGYFYAGQSTKLLWITPDPVTKQISGTAVWSVDTGQSISDLVYSPTNQLFVADAAGVMSYAVTDFGPIHVMRAPFPNAEHVVVVGVPVV